MLPFDHTAQLEEQGGAVVAASIDCHVEQGRRADQRGGPHRSFDGIAPLALTDELKPNRQLRMLTGLYTGSVLRIVSSTPHDALPHVEFELRKQGG